MLLVIQFFKILPLVYHIWTHHMDFIYLIIILIKLAIYGP